MNWWQNLIQRVVMTGVMFLGFYFIHKSTLNQETTKITNHIDQKFKRVTGDVNAVPTIENPVNTSVDSFCVPYSDLSNREKRRLKRKAGQ